LAAALTSSATNNSQQVISQAACTIVLTGEHKMLSECVPS
jgi:hypothetical protein